MKLLKLLIHAVPAGASFALLLALLIFFLNPGVSLTAASLWAIWLPLAAVYGTAATLAWPVGLLILRFFAERPLNLPWLGFPLFHRFYLINASVAAAVWWANYAASPALLSPADHRLLLAGCGLLTLGCALGGLLSLQRSVFRTEAVRWGQGALILALFLALAGLRAGSDPPPARASVSQVEMERGRPERRVVLVAVDGLSLDLILPLVADGKAPSFRRMMREGAWGRIESFVPTAPPVIWTTVATGVLPYQHGIQDFERFITAGAGPPLTLPPRYVSFRRLEHLGLLSTRPVVSGDRRTPALWNILSQFGMEVGIVEWWATFPPEPLEGVMVPHPPGRGEAPAGAWAGLVPDDPTMAGRVEARLGRMADWGASPPEPETAVLEETVRQALTLDLRALDEADRIEAERRPSVLALYLPGLDAVQHYFLGYALAASQSEGADRPGALYGDVVSRYYRFLDEALEPFLAPREEDPRLVLVVSGFGVERVPPWNLLRVSPRRPVKEGYHDRAPAGAFLALGDGVASGAEVPPARPADILPTLLYYLGLPVGRDMDGRPRIDLFDEDFTGSHPLGYLPSYRTVRGVPATGAGEALPPS